MPRCFNRRIFTRSLTAFAFAFLLGIVGAAVWLKFLIPEFQLRSLSENVPAFDSPPPRPLIDGGFEVKYKYSLLGRTGEDSLEAYFELKNNSSEPLYVKADADTGVLDSWTTNADDSFANIAFSNNLVTKEIPPFRSVTLPAPLTPTHFRPEPQPFVLELDYSKGESQESKKITVKVRKQRVFDSPEIAQSSIETGGR